MVWADDITSYLSLLFSWLAGRSWHRKLSFWDFWANPVASQTLSFQYNTFFCLVAWPFDTELKHCSSWKVPWFLWRGLSHCINLRTMGILKENANFVLRWARALFEESLVSERAGRSWTIFSFPAAPCIFGCLENWATSRKCLRSQMWCLFQDGYYFRLGEVSVGSWLHYWSWWTFAPALKRVGKYYPCSTS